MFYSRTQDKIHLYRIIYILETYIYISYRSLMYQIFTSNLYGWIRYFCSDNVMKMGARKRLLFIVSLLYFN